MNHERAKDWSEKPEVSRTIVWLIQINTATVRGVQLDSRTELVIGADIAKRLGISPQRVNVLISGPGFPKPLGKLGRSRVWRWSTIERWARENGRLPAAGVPE